MAAETLASAQWLTTTLKADGTLAGLFGGTVRVYQSPLPQGVTFPVIELAHAGALDNQGVGTDRLLVTDNWLVKVVDRTTDVLPAGTIWARVDAVLHGAGGTAAFGRVYAASRQTATQYAEAVDGNVYQHVGGTFRLWTTGV